MKYFTYILLLSSLLFSSNSYAVTVEQLEKKLEALEEEILLLKDETSETNQNISKQMEISGYTDIEYHASSKKGDNPGFRLHHFSVFFKKKIAEKWHFFSEIEYEDAPYLEGDGEDQPAPAEGEVMEKARGKIFVEAVNIDYLLDPMIKFRAGRFFTPAGIWSIDHYPPFVPTQLRPQHIRKIFPQVVDGAMVYGSLKMGSTFLNYDLYGGNGEGNTAKKDQNSSKASGLKLGLVLPLFEHFELGATVYKDELNDETDKFVSGGHFKTRLFNVSFQAEYARARLEPKIGEDYFSTGYYAQIFYDWRAITVGYRYDSFEKTDLTPDTEIVMNGVFINYHINKDIVLKLEHHNFDLKDELKDDYQTTILSIVAYLGN